MRSFLLSSITSVAAACLVSAQTKEQPKPTANAQQSAIQSAGANVYQPYEFLIGDWDVKSEGDERTMAVQHVRWGPSHSYIWYEVALLADGREEPHLEGILVWNGVHKNLDMLFVIDLEAGRSQEQGTIAVQSDGTLVREITAVHSAGVATSSGKEVGREGATAHFRQTYKQSGPDKIKTSVMRQTDKGWVPSFPGSDAWIMTRRTGNS